MNKLTAKNIILFSISLLIISLMSCASTKEVVENPYDYIEPKINPKTKKPYDFNGMNIIIGDWYTDPDANPKGSEAKNKKAWNEWTNKTYNVNIQQKMVWGPKGYFDMVENYCVDGFDEDLDGNSYVFIIDESIAQQGVRGDLFYDLSKIRSISYYDLIKYNQNAVSRLQRGRSFYSFGWEKNEPLCGVYFNKRILQEHGYTSEYIYDLQAEGKWTWDVFEKLCMKFTKDTDYDGDTDIWAMSSDMMDFASLCLDSNDTALVSRDIDGNFCSTVVDYKTMAAFYWMKNIWQKYQYPRKDTDDDTYFYKPFVDGKTAFLVGHQDARIANSSLTDMKDDYGFVCFPLGPNSEGVYKTLSNPKMVVIPSWYSDERVEKIAKALDLWLIPVPNNSGSDAWKKNYSGLYRDSRANDETLTFMGSTANPRLDVLIKDFPSETMYYNILNGINSPEEEHYFTKQGISLLLEDTNKYWKKVSSITEEELQELIEEEIAKAMEEYEEEEAEEANENSKINLMDAYNDSLSDDGDSDGEKSAAVEADAVSGTEGDSEDETSNDASIKEVSKKTKKNKKSKK